MCSSNNCKESRGLIAGHNDLCIFGKCSCGEKCKFINCSRNCRKKCKENYGHKEEHICEENEGCKELCRFQYENLLIGTALFLEGLNFKKYGIIL